MPELNDFKVTGDDFKLENMPTSTDFDKDLRVEIEEKTEANNEAISNLQEKLYADGREGVIMLLQAMDAAGKDSTIKRVMSGVNPQGVQVVSFKQPSSEDLAHDYLWRVVKSMPVRGDIAIFNRSYYEDVLVVQVHDLQKNYKMPKRCIDIPKKEFFDKRYQQIKDFENYYYQNGYRFLKIFLNVSKAKQKERFLERIDTEQKNWKFSSADVEERKFWDEYHKVYQDVIRATATKENPWYVIPADQKWGTRYLVSEALKEVLEACKSEFPELPEEELKRLEAAKQTLESE